MVKKSSNTKAMKDALQAAVSQMNGASAPIPTPQLSSKPNDPLQLFTSLLLPMLLEQKNVGDEDGVPQEFERLRNDEIKPLRELVERQNESIERICRAQDLLMRKLRILTETVSVLTDQLSRIELIGEPEPMPPLDPEAPTSHDRNHPPGPSGRAQRRR